MSIAVHKIKEAFNLAAHQPVGWREGIFTNQYHSNLRYGFAPALGGHKNGTIILTHGYGEFIDQYYLTIQEYQKLGYDVWAMDHYGFGKSGRDDPANPHRPSTKGLLRHVNDLDFFATQIVKPVPEKPLILSTHSMGGHIGLLHLQRHPGVFDGAIMSSPMFDIYRFGLPRFTMPLIRTLFNVASAIGFRDKQVPATPDMWDKITSVSHALTDSDGENLRTIFKNLAQGVMHQVLVSRPTFGWISSSFPTMIHSMRESALSGIKTPILIGSAGIESLVDTDSHDRAARLMQNAAIIRLPMARHNLWFESDRNYDLWIWNIRAFLSKIDTGFESRRPASTAPVIAEPVDRAAILAAFPQKPPQSRAHPL